MTSHPRRRFVDADGAAPPSSYLSPAAPRPPASRALQAPLLSPILGPLSLSLNSATAPPTFPPHSSIRSLHSVSLATAQAEPVQRAATARLSSSNHQPSATAPLPCSAPLRPSSPPPSPSWTPQASTDLPLPGPLQPSENLHPALRIPPPHPTPVGGRLRLHAAEWPATGASGWVLSTIRDGLRLELTSWPHQLRRPPETTPTADRLTLQQELKTNLLKGAVEPVPSSSGVGFYSTQFTVPKADSGRHRQVSNLRPLNQFLVHRHFKMESLTMLQEVLQQGDLLMSLDIQDAFFHVSIHPEHVDLLRFEWEGTSYRFRAMPFGLASAPRVFTKIMRPVMGLLRSRGQRGLIYLDDLLIASASHEEALHRAQATIDLLYRLGFTINFEKSALLPSHSLEYLGFLIDTRSMTISLPAEKVAKLRKAIRTFSRNAQAGPVSPREVAGLVGKLQATHPALLEAPLYVRHLRAAYLKQALHSWETPSVLLPEAAWAELRAWLSHLETWNGRLLIGREATRVLVTDASRTGWGAWLHLPQSPRRPLRQTWGFWMPHEKHHTSNWREATAILLALRAFSQELRGHSVLLRTDNRSAMAAINKGGSSVLVLSDIARATAQTCRHLSVALRAEHITGATNRLADQLSRIRHDVSDWMLNPTLFLQISQRWFLPTIDLFASRTNRQVPRFYSYRPDPEATGIDAFLHPWKSEACYANPPFAMIGRVLAKIRKERLEQFILVAPIWPSASWWPVLLQMVAASPLLLPRTEATYLPGLTASSAGIGPPNWHSAAFLLCAQPCAASASPRWRSSRPNTPSEQAPPLPMIAIGESLWTTSPLFLDCPRLSMQPSPTS